MRTSLPFLLACLSLSSCSNELTREDARRLISQHYQLPRQTMIVIDRRFDNYGWPPERYRQLENMGLISLREMSSNFLGKTYEVSPTENAREYWLRNGSLRSDEGSKLIIAFKGYTVDVGDVRVSSNSKESTARAEVTMRFSNISPIQTVFDPLESNEKTVTIFFRLFDDGWRIMDDENSERVKEISAPQHWAGGWRITYDNTPIDIADDYGD